jgi:Fic family protein
MSKKKKTPFKVWENTKQLDGYIRLAYGLLDNEVFKGLSGNAFKLYVYMREWAYRNEKSNGQYLTYSLSLAQKALGVSEPTANKALLELESKHIIKRLNNSRYAREASQWEFTDEWYNKG